MLRKITSHSLPQLLSAQSRWLPPPRRRTGKGGRIRRLPSSHWGPGFGIGYVGNGFGGDGCYVTRRVPTPFGFRWRTINICGY